MVIRVSQYHPTGFTEIYFNTLTLEGQQRIHTTGHSCTCTSISSDKEILLQFPLSIFPMWDVCGCFSVTLPRLNMRLSLLLIALESCDCDISHSHQHQPGLQTCPTHLLVLHLQVSLVSFSSLMSGLVTGDGQLQVLITQTLISRVKILIAMSDELLWLKQNEISTGQELHKCYCQLGLFVCCSTRGREGGRGTLQYQTRTIPSRLN